MEVKGICPKADFVRTVDMANGMTAIRYDEHDTDNGMVEFSEQSCKADDVPALVSQLISEDISRKEMFSQWSGEKWYQKVVLEARKAQVNAEIEAYKALAEDCSMKGKSFEDAAPVAYQRYADALDELKVIDYKLAELNA